MCASMWTTTVLQLSMACGSVGSYTNYTACIHEALPFSKQLIRQLLPTSIYLILACTCTLHVNMNSPLGDVYPTTLKREARLRTITRLSGLEGVLHMCHVPN